MPHTFLKTLNVSHILNKKLLECITGQYCAFCLNIVLQLFHFSYITSQYCAFALTWYSSYITIICYLPFLHIFLISVYFYSISFCILLVILFLTHHLLLLLPSV